MSERRNTPSEHQDLGALQLVRDAQLEVIDIPADTFFQSTELQLRRWPHAQASSLPSAEAHETSSASGKVRAKLPA
ncbi:hypothetical protein N7474_010011 [Penicillium riverlandense]|uniref:uncharacterized protein n=1 Tax=Penicillium riverlandense TaxID=1903569 RepID=UPI002547E6FD|nr:uncharacterized protein N7474_010011 [Penicillium riverlandense]KAJ5808742.1 hypothetical protein N7474_010011 [Penicillium riverlandense]